MMKKGDKTKTAILEAAKDIFARNGYGTVTMKDFCDALELSRGGLYRHFSSTKEIFVQLLERDKETSAAELAQAIKDEIPAKQLILHLMNTKKKEITEGGGRLTIAIYEFCNQEGEAGAYLENRFNGAVEMVERLLDYGQKRGELLVENPREMARHIVLFLEGLKISSAVVPIKGDILEEQLSTIYKMVKKTEEKG